MRHLLACLLAGALVLTGCAHVVDGHGGPRDVDRGFFFAGAVPVYGRTVSTADAAVLAYLRALRRIDVCGLVGGDVMAKTGELHSVGTLYAFSECDVDVKVSGAALPKFVAAELVLAPDSGAAVAFRVGDTPVYASAPDSSAPGSCVYGVPLPLSALPGAPQLRGPQRPMVQVGLIADQDCGLARRIAAAVADRLVTHPLPPRDALAAYPSALAERDPCEVLTIADVADWDIGAQQPYDCRLTIRRRGSSGTLSARVRLQPEVVDAATAGLERREQDGAEIYVDHSFCSALSFVGPPMQRRLAAGGYQPAGSLVIRPAVTVDIGADGCAEAAGLAAGAAKLYG